MLYIRWPPKFIKVVEKLYAQTSWGDNGDQTHNLFSRNFISEMGPGSATGRQIGYDYGWKSSKTTYIFLKKLYTNNLEHTLQRTANDSTHILLTYYMEQSPSWKATGFQLVKKFPAFYETRRFITVFTSARHLSLSCASSS